MYYVLAESDDCYILLLLFIFYLFFGNIFFDVPELIFAKLPHDAVCSEINCVL